MGQQESRLSQQAPLEAVRGVFVLPRPPAPELLEDGEFLAQNDFGLAGEAAGKSHNYGVGVMAEIALKQVFVDVPPALYKRGDPEYDLYWQIFYLMRNPDRIREGSRNLLLLSTQLVFEVLEASEGRMSHEHTPTVGAVGQRVLNQIFSDPDEIEELKDIR